jgi:hypothetical protein
MVLTISGTHPTVGFFSYSSLLIGLKPKEEKDLPKVSSFIYSGILVTSCLVI